ncbi:MAG: helix-turn-helix domain-containing protein [Acidobacteriota bacterium]|nr:helix-turn-helix domain-containing protein [Acidobacteriota bacterium]
MATVEQIRQVELVGRKIRQLRKERKLTQVELSARLGIQQSDLSRMEQGEYRVSLDTLFRILAEFKMSIGEFFEGVATESITPRDVRLVQEFNSLPQDVQREVEDFIAFKRTHGRPDSRDSTDSKESGKDPVRPSKDEMR